MQDHGTDHHLADANQLHERLQRAVAIERRAIREIARGIIAMQKTKLYKELGFAGLVEYGEQAFGFSASKTRQLATLGGKLPQLHLLDAALSSGALGWTKARTIMHIVTPETEQAWIERAMEVTCRDLEILVADARHGELPRDPSDEWEPPRHVWARFRLDVFHFEQLAQALAVVRHHLGDPDLSMSQLVMYMTERVLEGGFGDLASDAGSDGAASAADPPEIETSPDQLDRAFPINYRVIAHRCPVCDSSAVETRLGKHELHPATRAMFECDAEVVSGDDSAGKPGHVTRTIPPSTRRAVIIRDRGRCQVPGCRCRKHLDVHHIKLRSQGGGHDVDNLVLLCRSHHQMLHDDVLRLQRGSSGRLEWNRGSGQPLGLIASIWKDRAELTHSALADFEGPPGTWPCIEGYFGKDLEPPPGLLPDMTHVCNEDEMTHVCNKPPDEAIAGRYPRGRHRFNLGDQERMSPGWNGGRIPVP